MLEFLQNFHFLRPWVLLFFIIPIGLYFKNLSLNSRGSSWENVCDKNLLDFLLVTDKSLKKISIKKYIYTGLMATILAAAGPSWKKIEIPTFEVENPTMFVLSLAQDMQLTDVSPSRLERAKFMISDITENMPDGQFGLEVYSQEPYIITPLTDDIKIINSLLPQIVSNIVPDNGDRLDRAIDLALNRFKSAGYTTGNIIIFASDVGQRLDFALEKIKEATNLNYTIHIIDTSYSGNEKMQMLAQKGNGIYIKIKDDDIQKLLISLRQANQEKIKISQNLRSTYLDYGYYLVFICLLCMLPFFRRGLLVLLMLCCFASNAHAGFLLNDNQEALKLFNMEQYEGALEKFKDNIWRGVTLYKMDKKEEALKEFSKEKDELALYNSGVVLTKLCQYEKALEAFNETLKLNPNNEDAAYNKQVLEDLFIKAKDDPSVLNCQDNQQQQQQDKQQKDNQQNENQDKNQQQNEQNSSSEDNNNQQNQDDLSQQQQNEQSNNQQQDNQNENSDNQQQQQQQNEQKNQNQDVSSSKNQENQQQDDTAQNAQQQDNQQSSQDNQPQQNNNDANSSSEQKSDSQPNEDNNTPTEADNNEENENQSQNTEGEDNNGTENQIEDQDVGLMNAKQGDEDTEYDEEALALRRRYREIPEDVGGLLREFIKKEYLRGRYKNED